MFLCQAEQAAKEVGRLAFAGRLFFRRSKDLSDYISRCKNSLDLFQFKGWEWRYGYDHLALSEFGSRPNTTGCVAKESLFSGHTHNVYFANSLCTYYNLPHLFPAWGLLDNRTIWDLKLKSQVEGFSVNSTLIFQAKFLPWDPQGASPLQNVSQ